MAEARGMRKTRTGVVVSDKMDKTIVVEIRTRVRHPLYGKIMNRTNKIKAHGQALAPGRDHRKGEVSRYKEEE